MRRTVLIAALLLVSASAQAGQSRNLSLAGSGSHPPISAPLPPTPANVIAEAPPATTAAPVAPAPVAAPAPAPVAQAAPAPITAAPETGAPPVAAAPVPPPLPPVAPAATAAPAAAPAADTPKYVERPTVAPATTDAAKVDDGKPSRRAERRHRGGGYWTAGRIMGELQRYGVSYGYSW
jgi:hypothetical protein